MLRTTPMRIAQVHQADCGAAPPPEAAVEDSVQKKAQDFPLVIATMPATGRQRKIAVGVIILLAVATAVIAPFASIEVTRVDAFIPVVQTVLSVGDFITAILLFAQFSIQPQRALLALASGYIFSGSFALLQTLTFPGAYAPAGLIGDGFNTPGWLFVLWHTTFPTAILVYALSKDESGVSALPGRSTMTRIGTTVAYTLALTAGLTWIVTTKTDYLPSLYAANVTLQTRFANQINVALWLWGTTALAVLFARRRTILDLWLMVTLLAWMPNFLVAAIASSVRFSIGWYAARCFVLIGSYMLLTVLLIETTFLYSRLASAIILQRRERTNRLLSVDAVTAAIAHELRTPLGAIALNAGTALSQLRSNPPELDEMEDILTDIEAESHRAGAIISSIRELSRETTDRRALTRVEDVARLVLRLLQHDLQINEVSVATEFQGNLPEVHLDSMQLQQVLLNLFKNAIDAMSSVPPEARHLWLTTGFDGHSTVLLSVQDSGPGIPVKDRERIFDPFFTTKFGGMGLGLAICFTVVENHGGKLRLVKSDSDGSIFELAMPVGG
jgi:signal transduction histidine kinase